MSSGIIVEGLSIYIDGEPVVKNLSFELKGNGLYALIGRVGSGKSLVLKCIAGLLSLYPRIEVKGSISVLGLNPLEALKRRFVAYVPQDPSAFFIAPTPREELELMGIENGTSPLVKGFSASELFELCVRVLAHSNAKVMLIEEPSSYLDGNSLRRVMELLRDLANEGKIVVISDHRLEPYSRYVDEALFIEGGTELRYLDPGFINARFVKPFVKAEGVLVNYGGKVVNVSKISIELRDGDVITIVAPNSYGKTTFIKALLRLVRRVRGKVVLKAHPFLIPQVPSRLFAHHSIEHEVKALKVDPKAILNLGIVKDLRRNPYTLSVGEARALMLALSIASPIKNLVIIDEVTLGLDDELEDWFREAIRLGSSLGKAFLITTHSRSFARLVRDGKVIELS